MSYFYLFLLYSQTCVQRPHSEPQIFGRCWQLVAIRRWSLAQVWLYRFLLLLAVDRSTIIGARITKPWIKRHRPIQWMLIKLKNWFLGRGSFWTANNKYCTWVVLVELNVSEKIIFKKAKNHEIERLLVISYTPCKPKTGYLLPFSGFSEFSSLIRCLKTRREPFLPSSLGSLWENDLDRKINSMLFLCNNHSFLFLFFQK